MREEYIGSNEGALVVLPICDLWDEIDAQRIKCRRISTSVIFIQLAKMWCGLVLLWCYATASLDLLAVLVSTCGVGCRSPPLPQIDWRKLLIKTKRYPDQKIKTTRSRPQDQDHTIKITRSWRRYNIGNVIFPLTRPSSSIVNRQSSIALCSLF